MEGINELAKVEVFCEDKSCQISTNVIPTIGSHFSFATTRDGCGDYRIKYDTFYPGSKEGDIQTTVEGIVVALKYHYEETGYSAQTNRKAMYVKIKLRPLNIVEKEEYKDW